MSGVNTLFSVGKECHLDAFLSSAWIEDLLYIEQYMADHGGIRARLYRDSSILCKGSDFNDT